MCLRGREPDPLGHPLTRTRPEASDSYPWTRPAPPMNQLHTFCMDMHSGRGQCRIIIYYVNLETGEKVSKENGFRFTFGRILFYA